MIKVLVIEDDKNIRKMLCKTLENNGYDCIEANNGIQGLEQFETTNVDMIITDIMMPRMDGNEFTTHIRRKYPDIPILMLTALEDFQSKEKGFISGTDDYMVKPIDTKEMLLRIKALLRRYKLAKEKQIKWKNIKLSYDNNSCLINEKNIELTKKEFQLLFKLMSNPNIIYTREQLMNAIWGYNSLSYDRTVDTHIKKIRERIKAADFEIITVRGLGYKGVLK